MRDIGGIIVIDFIDMVLEANRDLVLRRLVEHYAEHPELLPAGPDGARPSDDVELAERVTDYLAGMTDRYCIREYTELQVPRAFAR